MLKKLHFKSWLLMLVMLLGVTNAWADEAVYTFNTDAGLTALGITKPAASAGTELGTDKYVVGDITMSATSGSTATRVWNSSGTTDLRIYKNGTFTFSSSYTITKIVLAGGTVGGFTADNGTFSSGTWTGTATSVTLTATATEKINTITVTYSTSAVTPTYTVTYDANGGSGTMTDDNSPYEKDAEVTLLANTFTAPSDMIWDSWKVMDDANNVITVTNGKFTMPANNVTVKAQWVVDPNAPQYEWVETNLADLTASDVFVIVGNNGSNYAMTNNNGTNSAPAASGVTVVNGKITSTVANNIKWNVSGNATDGYIFYPNGTTEIWLYCTNSNNGVRVGTNDNKTFVVDNGYLKHSGTSRYVGIYNSADWRCYTSIVNNIANQTFSFYKRVDANAPLLTASDVDLAYNATNGTISYTLTNPKDGGVLSAVSSENWLTVGTPSNGSVALTCLENSNTTVRTATVTLTYTYNTNETVTKTVTVTQGVNPNITTIPALFAAATNTSTPVSVTFDNWVVTGVNGSQAFVTDGTNGFIVYQSGHNFNVGDQLSGTASCNLVLYNGSAELTGLTSLSSGLTVNSGGTVGAVSTTIGALNGVNTGSVVTLSNLTCSVSTSGDYTNYDLSDGTNTIRAISSIYDFTDNPDLVDGNTYSVTGIFCYNTSTVRIYPRSADDIEEVLTPTIPTIAAEDVEIASDATNGSIAFTVNNEVEGGAISATTQDTWITLGSETASPISFTCEANTGAERTATVTLTYTYNTNETVTKDVTVTQAAYVDPSAYVAIVGILEDGSAIAMSNVNNGKNKLVGVSVDVVNGKVINGKADDISWTINNAVIQDVDGKYLSGAVGGNTNLTVEDDEFSWTLGNSDATWTMVTSSTTRTFLYSEENTCFGNYAVSNIGNKYSYAPAAYTFADGYVRNVTAGNFGTICLPYAVAAEDFAGVTFYKISGKKMNGDELVSVDLEEVTELVAGAAYIFQANEGVEKLIAAYSGEEASTPIAAKESTTGLVGTYERTLIPQGKYVLKNGKVYLVNVEYYSGANKAYIDLTKVPESTSATSVKLFSGDGADAINAIEAEGAQNGAIYNLAGQRVSKATKGIFIKNGKKVVIK